ncbi:gastrin-releasing peptide receptor-like [Antedon mediterranea]|uniref:gastrin-releasing peptide receptor-like n=1 Tax=Antedon mediterranea TaxID=105859 RepID=UPI003AF60428
MFVIIQHRYMAIHNPNTNSYRYFFVNACSVSSVIFLLLCYIVRYVTPNSSITNPTICKCLSSIEFMFQSVMVYTLAALSVDRYCIVKTMIREKSFIARNRYMVMAFIVFASFLFTVPVIIKADIMDKNCVFLDYHSTFAKCYEISRACITYLLPVIVIAYLYSTMAFILFQSRTNETVKSVTNYKSQLAARSRLGISVLAITILFAVCYFPNTLHSVLYQFSMDHLKIEKVCSCLAKFKDVFVLCYACVHPIVLFATNRSYRRFARSFVHCRFHDMLNDRHVNATGTAATLTSETGRTLGKRTLTPGTLVERVKLTDVSVNKHEPATMV